MATAAVFKSLVPEVETADEIDDYVGYPLLYQFMFERKTSPWEMSSWDEEELQNFQIDVDQIDRLYSVTYNREDDDMSGDDGFYLLARMKYMDKDMFVELIASCGSSGFARQGGGVIYITSNPNIFYNTTAIGREKDKILSSLLEDGYDITVQPEAVSSWHNPPKLLFLCHKAVRDNQDCLAHYPEVLPQSLTNSLNDFIRVKEAMDDYDE